MTTEAKQIEVGITEALRYQEYVAVIEGVDLSVSQIKANCPVHGFWYFFRIGETKRFKCAHVNHLGKSVTGTDSRLDFVKQR